MIDYEKLVILLAQFEERIKNLESSVHTLYQLRQNEITKLSLGDAKQ